MVKQDIAHSQHPLKPSLKSLKCAIFIILSIQVLKSFENLETCLDEELFT